MPLKPLEVTLSDGQKLEALKRFYNLYKEELTKVELELTAVKTRVAEHEFLIKYLGQQPEVMELAGDGEKAEKLEKRRQHLSMLLDRLEQVIPSQGAKKPAVITRF